MFSIGGLVEKICDALHAPEWVGDIAKIGVGFVSEDPLTVMDGIADLTPNVCDFVENALDLGPEQPGEEQPAWKKLARGLVESQRLQANLFEDAKSLLGPAVDAGSLMT